MVFSLNFCVLLWYGHIIQQTASRRDFGRKSSVYSTVMHTNILLSYVLFIIYSYYVIKELVHFGFPIFMLVKHFVLSMCLYTASTGCRIDVTTSSTDVMELHHIDFISNKNLPSRLLALVGSWSEVTSV